jgi:PiT family inorganic phosphate transporter
MTLLKLPVSTSQSVIGSILGIGILNQKINLTGLGKVFACWVGTPFGAAIIAVLLYKILSLLFNRLPLTLFKSDILLRLGLLIVGAYGAYALGANNVANVSAVFVGAGVLTVLQAALIGGGSIALGIMTFSKPVMETVGKRLVRIDPFCGLIVVLSLAMTMHACASLGVPVSSSQAVIGGVLGVGLIKGMNTINKKTLLNIFSGWLLSPFVSCLLSLLIYFSFHLKYVPPTP